MNKERIKFFAKEVLIFIVLAFTVPHIATEITMMLYPEIDYKEDLFASKILFILVYLITPFTARIPKFGKLNRWIRFAILYLILSFV